MGKPKGLPKTGGRAKGVPNKGTPLINTFKDELTELLPKFIESLHELPPNEFVKEMSKLLVYILPKLSSQELVAEIQNKIDKVTIEVKKPE